MTNRLVRNRELRFTSWDAVLEDAEFLLEQGYTTSGNWTLGQAASHLAQWTSFPIDGYPKPPMVIGIAFRLMRLTGATRWMSNKILAEGFRPGSPTDPSTVPTSQITDREGVNQLEKALLKAKSHRGPLQPSPLFGEMSAETYAQVSWLHAAHHLGFFAPKST